ncbi:MAG TPA: hypothetical protein DDW52_19225 [Planctomycetaceae bacterium]|nr:hypothetical protein [Planctomycetaceae bacterium]
MFVFFSPPYRLTPGLAITRNSSGSRFAWRAAAAKPNYPEADCRFFAVAPTDRHHVGSSWLASQQLIDFVKERAGGVPAFRLDVSPAPEVTNLVMCQVH